VQIVEDAAAVGPELVLHLPHAAAHTTSPAANRRLMVTSTMLTVGSLSRLSGRKDAGRGRAKR
jgi:hypothetical protein